MTEKAASLADKIERRLGISPPSPPGAANAGVLGAVLNKAETDPTVTSTLTRQQDALNALIAILTRIDGEL